MVYKVPKVFYYVQLNEVIKINNIFFSQKNKWLLYLFMPKSDTC